MFSLKKTVILISCCFPLSVNAQIIIQENFNSGQYLSAWNFAAKVEQALWLGKENSNYVRFHPNFQNQFIETPAINLVSGNYTLFFDWNQAGLQSVDSVNVQLTADNGTTWQTIYAIYNANNRNWQTDSVAINSTGSTIKLKWNYFSSGSFPAQYFNIDNIIIAKNTATALKNNSNEIITEVFPNPNNGNFQLKILNAKNKKGTIFIYNTQGELIYQHNLPVVLQSLLQLDLSANSKGSYILTIQTDESSYSKSIIIQ
jgi:hypothetical protein